MTHPSDNITDESLEAMVKAAWPEWWASYCLATDAGQDPFGWAEDLADRLAAMRCAWCARPETARALDEASIGSERGLTLLVEATAALYARDRHLLSAGETTGEKP